MKTISIRQLHSATGKWLRKAEELGGIVVTDRGVPIASISGPTPGPEIKVDWRNRRLVPGYAKYLKQGKFKSVTDSSIGISEDRSSRDDSVAGFGL